MISSSISSIAPVTSYGAEHPKPIMFHPSSRSISILSACNKGFAMSSSVGQGAIAYRFC